MPILKKTCDRIENILIFIIAIAASIMILVTFVEVVRRYTFSLSFTWAEELTRYLMVYVTFLGGAVAFRRFDLIPLDLISSRLGRKNQLILLTMTEIVGLVLIIVLFRFSLGAVMSPSVYMQKSIGLPISMGIPFASMVMSFGFMLLFSIEHFLDFVKEAKELKEVA